MPLALARGISANAVSVAGLGLGGLAALAYAQWNSWALALVGLVLSVGWLIADGLDGMVARATKTASPLGRMLDGLCDQPVQAVGNAQRTEGFRRGRAVAAWRLAGAIGWYRNRLDRRIAFKRSVGFVARPCIKCVPGAL